MRSSKKILSMVLLGALALNTPRGIAQAALANDGDTQQNQVNVSMEVTAQDLGGVTVSIPSEIELTYNGKTNVCRKDSYFKASGYIDNNLRLSVQVDRSNPIVFTNITDSTADTIIGYIKDFSGQSSYGTAPYTVNSDLYYIDLDGTKFCTGLFDSDDLLKGIVTPSAISTINFSSYIYLENATIGDSKEKEVNKDKHLKPGTYTGITTFYITIGKPFVDQEVYKTTDTGIKKAKYDNKLPKNYKLSDTLEYEEEITWNLSKWSNDNGTPTYTSDTYLYRDTLVVPPYNLLGISEEDFTGTFKISSGTNDSFKIIYVADGYTKLTQDSFSELKGKPNFIYLPRTINNIQAGVFDSSFDKFDSSVNIYYYGTEEEFKNAFINGDDYIGTASVDLQNLIVGKRNVKYFTKKSKHCDFPYIFDSFQF